MKLLIILLLISTTSFSQKSSKDGWVHISYLLDKNGMEVAKRFEDSTWVISNPAKSLEKMYQEKIEAEKKYELAMGIIRQLNPNGTPKDQRLYNESVLRYNQYIQSVKKH